MNWRHQQAYYCRARAHVAHTHGHARQHTLAHTAATYYCYCSDINCCSTDSLSLPLSKSHCDNLSCGELWSLIHRGWKTRLRTPIRYNARFKRPAKKKNTFVTLTKLSTSCFWLSTSTAFFTKTINSLTKLPGFYKCIIIQNTMYFLHLYLTMNVHKSWIL